MKNNAGSSLVEVLVAILFVSLVAVALLRLAVLNVSTSSYSTARSQAEDYAKQTLEWLGNEKKLASWPAINDTWCMPDLDWNTQSPCGTQKIGTTVFQREVALVIGSPDQVNVRIFWSDSRGTHEVRKDALFGNEEY